MGRGKDEDGAEDNNKRGDESGREVAGGKSAAASAGIGGVDGSVGESIEGHGGGAGGEHGDDDPEKLMDGGQARSGEQGSAERERKRKDRMLPLDHFEGDAKVVKDGHAEIVKQFSVPRMEELGPSRSCLALRFRAGFLCERLGGTPKLRCPCTLLRM